ncbi:hypothetical protein [Paenibacillus sp. Mc5Re-14]|uniref:hypothetical protein n=1 Tax=Paenibacillus sp. Mc5Re-14 TaxID=1030529 RepID=UPI000A5CA552|nr:hypothetical protein [Paenibacillus sp. Mc5Re-14]
MANTIKLTGVVKSDEEGVSKRGYKIVKLFETNEEAVLFLNEKQAEVDETNKSRFSLKNFAMTILSVSIK